MNTKNFPALLIFCAAISLFGADASFVEEEDAPVLTNATLQTSDKKLETLISQIDRAARRTRTFCADYKKIEYTKNDQIEDEAIGRIYLQRVRPTDDEAQDEYRFRFEYYQPKAAVTIIDGSSLYAASQNEKRTRSIMVDNRKLEVIFAGFMSISRLKNNYVISRGEENAKNLSLILTPESKLAKSLFKSVRLTFDRTTLIPSAIYQERNDGSKNVFLLAHPKINHLFSSQVFDPEQIPAFIKKYRVKPPPSIVTTNFLAAKITNNVPYQVTDKWLTPEGEKEATTWSIRQEIKDVILTNIIITPVKQKDPPTLPL